jgi:hypothetical protein
MIDAKIKAFKEWLSRKTTWGSDYPSFVGGMEAKQPEIDRLRKALEFYSDGRLHRYVDHGVIFNDQGKVARDALAFISEENWK